MLPAKSVFGAWWTLKRWAVCNFGGELIFEFESDISITAMTKQKKGDQ